MTFIAMSVYVLPIVSSGVWCMSALQPGTVLTDINVYKQRCYIVLNTPIGSDPLRPLFGCNYYKYIDGNTITAPAKIKTEIIDAITLWVPEVKPGKITYSIQSGKLMFSIQLIFNGQSIKLPFQAGRGNFFNGIAGTKIINREFPFESTVVSVSLTVDGIAVSFPGILPWDSMSSMITWLRANKSIYGVWGLSKDELILYLDSKYKTAEMAVTKVS